MIDNLTIHVHTYICTYSRITNTYYSNSTYMWPYQEVKITVLAASSIFLNVNDDDDKLYTGVISRIIREISIIPQKFYAQLYTPAGLLLGYSVCIILVVCIYIFEYHHTYHLLPLIPHPVLTHPLQYPRSSKSVFPELVIWAELRIFFPTGLIHVYVYIIYIYVRSVQLYNKLKYEINLILLWAYSCMYTICSTALKDIVTNVRHFAQNATTLYSASYSGRIFSFHFD